VSCELLVFSWSRVSLPGAGIVCMYNTNLVPANPASRPAIYLGKVRGK